MDLPEQREQRLEVPLECQLTRAFALEIGHSKFGKHRGIDLQQSNFLCVANRTFLVLRVLAEECLLAKDVAATHNITDLLQA